MTFFTIETKEFMDIERGWKKIAETTIIAENIAKALGIVSDQYNENQYIHRVLSKKETTDNCVIVTYF